ncbi:RNA terminal phosphate cyclase domain 1 [Reticulomyxa filosa]|uniref:RNA terminal phosphate cyclase domain 1 n=1 Tax=Reticulomyxa filosa TaxID=46433 RepID=X6LVW2_RETFI|nr:RNA terminal phosphate cyclase domain 1 [Reticulomyxa filosa]|eukprot:ETO06078.1 RNA terminal phosphate cyclase domain 1 [Reticulomyxa filosa]
MSFQPSLKRLMNVEMNVTCKKRGFFPHGGGEIVLQTNPISQQKSGDDEEKKLNENSEKQNALPAFTLTERGDVQAVRGIAIVTHGAQQYLRKHLPQNVKIQIDVSKEDTRSSASAIVVVAETTKGLLFGGSALGDKKIQRTNAQIGEAAAEELLNDLFHNGKNCCVDRCLQDQLIIFAALAKGKSEFKCGALELHTKTAIHFAEIMTGCKFKVTEYKNMKNENGEQMDCKTHISCEGIGLLNTF